jgi:hypothetical protein
MLAGLFNSQYYSITTRHLMPGFLQEKHMKIRILLLCITMLPMLAHAEIYKWKDKDGRVRYSDVPPPSNIKQESLYGKKIPRPTGQPPLAPADTETGNAIEKANEKMAAEKSPLTKEEAAARRARSAEQDKMEAESKQAEQEVNAENCKSARANLQTYNQGGRIVRVNEAGDREFLNDADIAKAKSEAQADIDKFCN